jgi:tetratricopeptide (TPR) repeat protein
VQRAACEAWRKPDGQAFARATQEWTGVRPDPCRAQPITDLAEAVVTLQVAREAEGAPKDRRPAGARWHADSRGQADAGIRWLHLGKETAVDAAWRRAYALGLGLSHALQERLPEARHALSLARDLAPDALTRARAVAVLASVAARQNAPDETEALVREAEALVGPHPALDRIRGDAWANVWEWSRAAAPYARSASGAPQDDESWRRLALALSSAGQFPAALAAAREGLELNPRDTDLLRLQATALPVGAPLRATALDAHLQTRLADRTPGIRLACSFQVQGCATEREPVHVH